MEKEILFYSTSQFLLTVLQLSTAAPGKTSINSFKAGAATCPEHSHWVLFEDQYLASSQFRGAGPDYLVPLDMFVLGWDVMGKGTQEDTQGYSQGALWITSSFSLSLPLPHHHCIVKTILAEC